MSAAAATMAARARAEVAGRAALGAADAEAITKIREHEDLRRVASVAFVGYQSDFLYWNAHGVTITYTDGETATDGHEDEARVADVESVHMILDDVYDVEDWFRMVMDRADADLMDGKRPHVLTVQEVRG